MGIPEDFGDVFLMYAKGYINNIRKYTFDRWADMIK